MTKTPNLLELSRRSWKEVLNIFSNNIIHNGPGKILENKTTRLLPRKDAVFYGEFPKLDTIVLVKCNKCGNVLTPSAYRDHYNNPDHDKTHAGSKSIPNNANKVTKPNSYIPPGTSLLKKKYQQPKNNKKKTSLPTVVPPPPPPPPVFTKQSPPPPVITLYENPPLTPPISKPASPPQQSRVLFSSGSPSNGKPKKTKKSGKRSQDKDKKVAKTESTTEVTTTLPKTTSSTPRKERPKPKDFQVMIDLTVADMPSLVKSNKDSTTTSTTFKNTIPFTEEDSSGKTVKALDSEPSVEEGVRVALEVVVKVLHMSSFRNSHTSVAEILDNEKSKVHLPTAKIPYSIHACRNVKGLFDKSSTEMNKPIRLINKNDLQCPECRELLKYTACSWKDITEVYNRDMKKYVGKKLAENEITNNAEYDVELYYALWHDKGTYLKDKTLKGSVRKDNTTKTDSSKVSDTMVVVECVKCSNVLLPCIYQDHYTQADHVKTSHTNKRSNVSSLKSIPPGTSLLKKKYQPVKSKKSDIPPAVPAVPLALKNTSKHTIIATYEEPQQILPVIKSTSPKQVFVSTVTDSNSNQVNNEEEMENMDAQVEEDVMAMLAQLAPIADSPTFNDWQVLSDLNGSDVPSPSQRTATTSPFVTITPAPQQSCMETNDLLKLLDEAIASVSDNSTSVVEQPLSPVDIANLPVQNIDQHPPRYCVDTVDIIKSLNDAIEIASCDINTHENLVSPLSIVYQSVSPSEIIDAPEQYSASPTSIGTAETIELLKNLNETISSCSRRQNNQRRVENHSVPYHPASPIDFVHHPVQFFQESSPIDSQSDTSIENPGIMMLIPILNGVPNYTSHPKPLTMNTRSIRKIGTTYILQSQRMDDQRNDIHSVLKKTLNSFHHRPNILKNSVRNNMKVGTKRTISERLTNDNNKHARLNDVNGFVLHTDTSESSDSNSVGFLK